VSRVAPPGLRQEKTGGIEQQEGEVRCRTERGVRCRRDCNRPAHHPERALGDVHRHPRHLRQVFACLPAVSSDQKSAHELPSNRLKPDRQTPDPSTKHLPLLMETTDRRARRGAVAQAEDRYAWGMGERGCTDHILGAGAFFDRPRARGAGRAVRDGRPRVYSFPGARRGGSGVQGDVRRVF